MKGLREKDSFWFVIVLTLVVGISYGIGINRLSFYGDDWIYIYNYHIAGSESFTLFTHWDRPYSAWIYVLTSALFGESPLPYHIYLLVLRWLSAFLFWKVLSTAFGAHKTTDAAALLFATYPGFQQQPIAVEFVMHFISLALVLVSLYLMQTAYFCKSWQKYLLLILSLASGALALFTCEYFLGLELARPFFLLFTIKSHEPIKNVNRKQYLILLIPYFCCTVFYFIWRIFIFSFTTYAPKLAMAFRENPVNAVLLLIKKVLSDLITVFVRAYRLVFARPANISLPLSAGILLLITAAVFAFMFWKSKISQNSQRTSHWAMLILGCAALLLSGIPYWGTFLDVSTDFPWDRSTLSFSPGVSIILAVILNMAFKPFFFCASAALLTALSALFQVQNTQVYIYESEKMNDYFWQLAWRAPALEAGTILASEDIPLDRTSDNDLSPVVNWQYAPENKGLEYAYKYFDLHLREETFYAHPVEATTVDHTYRSHHFNSSTEKTLGIFYKKNGCLQIIDSMNTGYPDLSESLIRIAPLSHNDLIITDSQPASVPPLPIGNEPEHGYCYYFQKITLSQQKGNTDDAYIYAQEALRSDLHPHYAPDLAPLVLAFLEQGDVSSAEQLISGNTIGSGDVDYLCSYWQDRIPDSSSDPDIQFFYKRHGCL